MVQVVVATGKGNLAYLEVEPGKLNQVAHHQLEVEVACVDITPIGQSTSLALIHFRCFQLLTMLGLRIL